MSSKTAQFFHDHGLVKEANTRKKNTLTSRFTLWYLGSESNQLPNWYAQLLGLILLIFINANKMRAWNYAISKGTTKAKAALTFTTDRNGKCPASA